MPRSHSRPFVTTSSRTQQRDPRGGCGDTVGMENKGNVWDVGDRLHTLGKGQLQALNPLSVCGMQLR